MHFLKRKHLGRLLFLAPYKDWCTNIFIAKVWSGLKSYIKN